jgi:dTDP-4-dehydrorhamnose 3,5-epimerase
VKFTACPIRGVVLVALEPRGDERGFFARSFCAREFAAAGLESAFVQANTSHTARLGTLRGMHYQLPPAAEVKLVRCVRGAVHDVVVDLRPDSPTFLRSFGARLDDRDRQMLYVPRGVAHGFISLTDDVELHYLVSAFYDPEQERGLRHDDPALAIDWPLAPSAVSAKDASWPLLDPAFHGLEAMRGLVS